MGDRAKPKELVHLLEEAEVKRYRLDKGYRRLPDRKLDFRVGIHYNEEFNDLAKLLKVRPERGEQTSEGIELSFEHRGWTFYTYLPNQVTKTQKIDVSDLNL